jgi:thiosulfate reductase cytochrome b subunit
VSADSTITTTAQHSSWVKWTHWIGTISFLLLVISGSEILMVHPRLYWGNVGNDLTPAWIELPISRNYHHGGWEERKTFFNDPAGPVSESRTFRTFNHNSWGRSLHFLAGWVLVATGAVYLLAGISSGHFRRHLLPRVKELRPRAIWMEAIEHMRLRIRPAAGAPDYGILQKCAYSGVVFFGLPGIVLSGLAMSPAITAAHPGLLKLWGGYQSARSIHFLLAAALLVFTAGHVTLVIKSGFRKQLRGMTLGKKAL